MLAFACAFTMFAGAAFTDEADIKATDAVNMLTALGVIEGDPDGSFRPDATVTRAEMAKMIFVVRNNTIDDSAYENNSSKLTDINSHWAKGYIKFCESQGIIAGYGDNTFKPDATVTGVEAAKMLLVLAGYDADKAGLVGHNWSTNTLKYAGSAGLLDDVNSGLEQGLPRQYAAQMIYNTLDTNRVKWSNDSQSFDDILNGGVKETVGKAYMGLSSDVGTLISIDRDSLTIKLDESYDSDNYHKIARYDDVTFTKVSEDYTSLLGQKVKVMFKDEKTNNVLGVYSISDNTVYTTLMNGVEKDGAKIKFGGKSYSIDGTKIATTFISVDGAQAEKAQSLDYFDKGAALNENESNGNLSTDEVTFVDANGNGKIDTAIVFEKLVGEVTYVSSDKITAGSKTYKFEDENIDEDIEQDDWAVVSANLYEDCKDVVKADIISTTLDGSRDKNDKINGDYKQYKLDGTWYNISDENASDVSNGDSVKAYVVNGVIVKIKSDDGKGGFPTNVAVVVSNGTINGDQVRIRYFDGTSKLVTISDNTKVTLGSSSAGKAYKVSGSDTSMKFEAIDTIKYNGYLYVGTGTADPSNDKVTVSTKDYTVDDSAAVILYDGNGRSKMLTGKQYNALNTNDLATSKEAGAVFTKDKNGLNRAMMITVKTDDMTISGESFDNYAYVVTNNGQNKDGNASYTIWTTDNEYVDVIEENATARAKGTLIGYSAINSDNVISDVSEVAKIADVDTSKQTAVKGTASFGNDGTVYYGGNQSTDTKFISVNNKKFNVTADTAVLFVDSAADEDKQIGVDFVYGTSAMAKAEKYIDSNDQTAYSSNVMFQVDENGNDDVDLKVLVVDTTGAFDGKSHESGDDSGETQEKGDYSTKYAEISVEDKDIITGAGSKYVSGDKEVHVQLTVEGDFAEATAKASIDVDGYKTTQNITLKPGNTADIVIADVDTADAKVSVNITDITFTKVNVGVAAVETANLKQDSATATTKDMAVTAVAAAAKAKDETVTITVTGTNIDNGGTAAKYELTLSNGTKLQNKAGGSTTEITFEYTVTENDIKAGKAITLTATEIKDVQ
ncbi:S-layer homology domain-containing protein [Agathobaculum massiliense]|uniref:S-layer homology domain-containing protein n=1 Tax=Agathobaculum massiliense TaxID=3014267 RepID=UPI000D1DFBD8|nr:S-layer homology domain-containing protein [Agathobaculum massiliense]